MKIVEISKYLGNKIFVKLRKKKKQQKQLQMGILHCVVCDITLGTGKD
jgi:hypothetical protein